MTPKEAPICYGCKHFTEAWKCKAYPDGIPYEIITGEADHREPYKGDNGIQYEELKTE